MNMRPVLRKITVTAHITFSVGWLGAVAAFLAISIVGLTSHDPAMVRSTYLSMDLISRFVIVPMCFGALATGLIEAFGTPWGLVRYYWVVLKFGLTILATVLLLMHQFKAISLAAKHVSEVTATQLFTPDFTSLKVELVQKSALAILLLLAITILGVFKPWGLTSYGRRKLQQGGKTLRSVDNKVSSRVKAFVGVIVIFALLILILHLTGHGFGPHGH